MPRRNLVAWQVLETRTLVSRRWIEVREERVLLPNGHEIPEFHVIDAPSWTGALAVTQAGDVVLVRQYRHGIAGVSLELPAGIIEPGEEPAASARRELREETGFDAESWEPLASFAPEPSRHSVRAHFFLARGAYLAGEHAQEVSEDIDVLVVPRAELISLVERGLIVHGVHVAAILLAERRGLLTRG